MKIRNNSHPRGLDMGPAKRPLVLPRGNPLPEGFSWAAISDRTHRIRGLMKTEKAPPVERAPVVCPRCSQPFKGKSIRAQYCGDRCRQSAWKRRRRDARRG